MITDVDFTQDFNGVFNKDEVMEHLIEEHNFRMQDKKIK
jgi:hypothetical protein